jgi:uncharacterized protein (DUF433 family)
MKAIIWTESELEFLAANYPVKGWRWCGAELGKSAGAIKSKVKKLGIRRFGYRITTAQVAYITANRSHTPAQIAAHLGISRARVLAYIYRNHLNPKTYTVYSPAEIEFLTANFGHLSWKDIGAAIGRSADSTKNKATQLGLKRTAEECLAIKEKYCGNTRFQKGMLPACTLYNGATSDRTNKDGITYRHIRVEKAKWVLMHTVNWEQQNGPVPDGMILRCKNGNQLDCRPENWEPVTRTRHLELNAGGRTTLDDNYIINTISRGDATLKETVAKMPGLIELKRNQLKLRRAINECTD